MNNKPTRSVLLLLAALVLTSCGGETSGSPDSTKAADSSPEPSQTESESESPAPEPEPSGTLETRPVACKKFSAPAGFQQAGAMPPLCAFESKDARVQVAVGDGQPSFEILQMMEDNNAKANGVAPPVLEEVTVDGWTYAVVWPETDGYNRIDRHLVDSAGRVLTCKVGAYGKVEVTTHADFCDEARSLLYTP